MRRYAGIVSRGTAFFVDAGIAMLVCTLGFQFVRGVLAAIGITTRLDDGAALGFLLALPTVFVVYCAGFWSLIGRTPGMMLLGLRVVTVDDRPPGVLRSTVRALCYFVSAILLLGFLWIAVDRRNQAFHDKIAGTFVVYDWLPRPVVV